MTLSSNLALELPYLRRYARALTGSQRQGDAYVKAALEAVIADRGLLDGAAHVRVRLYKLFHGLWNSAHREPVDDMAGETAVERTVQQRLALVTPLTRQALLLTTLEGFSCAEAGVILDQSEQDIRALVTQAIADIDRETAADVLVIEDEPLIAMQLEQLVETLGHRVCGTASTRTEALACVAQGKPELVLADIQLADGSSGLDAVNDILARMEVPVIFITAFPERLLTGERPEPTYLITKPFQEVTVKAAVSQALFLGSTARGLIAA